MAKSNKSQEPGTTFDNFVNTASTKDKAIVYAIKYDDRIKNQQKPDITKEQAKRLIESVNKDERKRKTFDKWMRYYLTIIKASQWFGYMYSELTEKFRRLERDYTYLNGLIREEAQYNYLIAKAEERGEESAQDMRDYILGINPTLDKAKIELAPGYLKGIRINASKYIKEFIERDIDIYLSDYSRLKSFLVAFKQYTKDKGITEFIPPTIREYASEIEDNDINSEYVDKYRRREVSKDMEKGNFITQMRKDAGLLPDYEDIETPEKDIKFWYDSLEREYERI